MKRIDRIPVTAWLLLIGFIGAAAFYIAGSQTAGILFFFLATISCVPRLSRPSLGHKREEVGLALLMRPVGYIVILFVALIIQILALYSYTYDWVHKARRSKRLFR